MSEQLSTAQLLQFLDKELILPTLPSFNRLEGRPRAQDFSQALRAEIRDPLWLLSKQWQMGEFKGDDAGSPVTAKACMKTAQLTKYQAAAHPAEAFDNSLPLEAKVEQRQIPFAAGELELALDLRMIMGRHWLKLLIKAGLPANLKQKYITAFSTHNPDPMDRDDVYYCASQMAWSKHRAAYNRHIDGKKLYDSIKLDPSQHPVTANADPADHPVLIDLGKRFAKWFEQLYLQPIQDAQDAWLPEKLEYQFACSAPTATGEKVFTANEYYHGHMDWYNFSIDPNRSTLGEVIDTVADEDARETIIRSFIPAPVRFDGMPNTRWWSFEEGKTNFGDIKPDTTDINKLLLIEFGLVYANDWYLLPVTLDAGSVLEIKGLTIKNVFGEHLWINPTARGLDDSANRWTMYSLDVAGPERRAAELALMVVPSVPKIQEGQPIETVQLSRDEMANMVWGIETRVPLPSGESAPGLEAARDTVRYLQRFSPATTEPVTPAANLRYRTMSSVPENWIPFLPTHIEDQNRHIQLQRGSMPRIIGDDIEKIKPRTNLLREGLNDLTKRSYFLHEEEVPRAGVIVQQSFQRTRWYDGRVYTWLGVRKRAGRGESSSQLRFDYLKPVKQQVP